MIAVDLRHECGAFRLAAAFESRARILALHGPSGAGKSTIAHLIAGLMAPTQGRISADGATLVDTARKLFTPPEKRRIGLVFQDALLFPHLDVRHNITFGRFFTPAGERRVPFESVVETLGIGHLLDRRPATLSGGEKQRVGLARALLSSPRLLLMDEPLASLDFARRQEIMGLIERLRDEFAIPILYVSHAADEIMRLADEVIVLHHGRVLAQGLPAETLASAGRLIEGGRFSIATAIRARAGVFDARYGVTKLAHPAGEIVIAAKIAVSDRPVDVLVKATDISLAKTKPADISVRTVLRATIAALDLDEGPLAFVRLELTGGERVTAAVTRLALDDMGLHVGSPVFALVKSVALDERGM